MERIIFFNSWSNFILPASLYQFQKNIMAVVMMMEIYSCLKRSSFFVFSAFPDVVLDFRSVAESSWKVLESRTVPVFSQVLKMSGASGSPSETQVFRPVCVVIEGNVS